VLRATAGSEADLNTVLATGNDLRQAELDAIEKSNDTLESKSRRIDGVNAKYGEMLEAYQGINSEAQRAVDKANLYRDATGEAATADQKRYEALARHIMQVPKEVPTKLTVDTADAERKIHQLIQKDRTIRVQIDGKSYGRY
jgi:hypothetical protein